MTCETNDPTTGTKSTSFASIPRSRKNNERPTVAPNPQEMPPKKLFTIISFFESLLDFSYGCGSDITKNVVEQFLIHLFEFRDFQFLPAFFRHVHLPILVPV